MNHDTVHPPDQDLPLPKVIEPLEVIVSWRLTYNLGMVVRSLAEALATNDPVQKLEVARFHLKQEIIDQLRRPKPKHPALSRRLRIQRVLDVWKPPQAIEQVLIRVRLSLRSKEPRKHLKKALKLLVQGIAVAKKAKDMEESIYLPYES